MSQKTSELFTKSDYETAASMVLASFIGWQVAVLNQITKNNVKLGMDVVQEAQDNIKTLMTGGSLPLGEYFVSLTNDVGAAMADDLAESIDDIASVLEAKEQNNVATH
jgi:hypothetical protein